MLDLPREIVHVLGIFAPLFSRPVYQNALQLFVGHILCKGRRTVTEILRRLKLTSLKNYSKFHWVLNGAKWSSLNGARILFQNILKLIPTNTEVYVALDATLERRRGAKIKGLGRCRDGVLSTKNNKVISVGIQWLVSAISIKLPFCKQRWALPFLSILTPPAKPLRSSKNQNDLNRKGKHKKITDWACQVASLIRRWAGKSTKLTLVADSAFACYKLAHACNKHLVSFITRIRLDARFFDFPPEATNRGRKRLVGKRLPNLTDRMKEDTGWQEALVEWYSGKLQKVLVQTGICLWYAYGIRPVAIRWVLVKEGNNEPVGLMSTNLEHTPKQIIEGFVARWALEVSFEESRRHLGVETQRQWSDKAIDRTTPILFASFSIVALLGLEITRSEGTQMRAQTCAWYRKEHITFSDVLACVRESILREKCKTLFGKKCEWGKRGMENLILELIAA